jgi:hypothetical protein
MMRHYMTIETQFIIYYYTNTIYRRHCMTIVHKTTIRAFTVTTSEVLIPQKQHTGYCGLFQVNAITGSLHVYYIVHHNIQ